MNDRKAFGRRLYLTGMVILLALVGYFLLVDGRRQWEKPSETSGETAVEAEKKHSQSSAKVASASGGEQRVEKELPIPPYPKELRDKNFLPPQELIRQMQAYDPRLPYCDSVMYEKMSRCTPYRCQSIYPAAENFAATHQVWGFTGEGTCRHTQTMPENAMVRCEYTDQARLAFARQFLPVEQKDPRDGQFLMQIFTSQCQEIKASEAEQAGTVAP